MFDLRGFGHKLFGGQREESRSRVAVSFGRFVELLHNVSGQGDVDANGFWLGALHANQNGYAGSVVRIGHDLFQG